MSDVYRRGTVYWCWVKNETGKWIRKSTGRRDKTAARLEKRRLERLYADPHHYAAHETKIEDAVKRFLEDRKRKGKADGTIVMYQQKCGHINRLFGARSSLASITAPRVDWFITKREEEGAKPHTIHKELVALRGVLKFAKRRGEYPADISATLPVGYSAEYVPRTTFLTLAQLEGLLSKLAPRRAAHVAYVVATGCRRAEASSATRADVAGAFARIHGSKTAKSARTIPVVTMFAELLSRALQDAPGSARLFEPWQNARRDILRACERAGVPAVTWNDLRRTFATLLKHEGVRNEDLADLLGHRDTKMVKLVYGQDTPERLADSVNRSLAHRTPTTQPDTESGDSSEKVPS